MVLLKTKVVSQLVSFSYVNYYRPPQPKRDIVLNVIRQKDRVQKTSPETATTDKPKTHLNKYKKEQNTKYYAIKPKDTNSYKLRLKQQL